MVQTKPLRVKDLPQAERPREKLLSKGVEALSDAELLAILLRTGTKEDSVVRVAEKLLALRQEAGIAGIAHLSVEDFSKVRGIGKVKAVTVLAALELGVRLAQSPGGRRVAICTPGDAADYVMPRLRYAQKEKFMLLLLNTKNQLLASPVVSVGSLNASIVHPREVFREVLQYAAASVILVHNHPSGDPSPSAEDIQVTNQLVAAGKIMDVAVLDHIVIGDRRYISLQEQHLME